MLYVQCNFPTGSTPRRTQNLKVTPKPLKSEYNTTKHMVRSWVAGKNDKDNLINIFLNTQQIVDLDITQDLTKPFLSLHDKRRLKNLTQNLNPEQVKS